MRLLWSFENVVKVRSVHSDNLVIVLASFGSLTNEAEGMEEVIFVDCDERCICAKGLV